MTRLPKRSTPRSSFRTKQSSLVEFRSDWEEGGRGGGKDEREGGKGNETLVVRI